MPIANCSWTAPANGGSPILDYRLRRNGTLRATIPAGTLTYADTTANYGDMYDVAARNAVGTGQYSSPQVQFAAAGGGGGSGPAPLAIWISKAELDTLPTSGSLWTGTGEVKTVADETWTADPITGDSIFGLQALAGALVYARLHPTTAADAYRDKVAVAIQSIINQPVDISGSSAFTRPARNVGAWPISADLINLAAHNPTLDADFRAWLEYVCTVVFPGSGSWSLFTGSGAAGALGEGKNGRPNNIGSMARFSLATSAVYLGRTGAGSWLDGLAGAVRRFTGESFATDFEWHANTTLQATPSTPSAYVGINPAVTRNGNNFSGVLPEDHRRRSGTDHGWSYDDLSFPSSGTYLAPADWPNPYSSFNRYIEESLGPMVAVSEVLRRNGYPTVLTWGNNAVRRACERYQFLQTNFGAGSGDDRGWKFFADSHNGGRPVAAYLFPTSGLSTVKDRSSLGGSQNHVSWTWWTHSGRTI